MKSKTKTLTGLARWVGLLCVLALAVLALAAPPNAPTPGLSHVSQFHLPVAGTFTVGNGEQSEPVDFMGSVHLVVDVSQPGDPCRVHVNLNDFTGIGQKSGLTYRVVGAANAEFIVAPPATLTFTKSFKIIPGNPITPPNPVTPVDPILPIGFAVSIAEDGTATAATAQIGQGSVDTP